MLKIYYVLESSESHGIGELKKYWNKPLARTWSFQFPAFGMQLGSALFSHVVEGSFFKMAASPLWENRGSLLRVRISRKVNCQPTKNRTENER